MVFAAVKQKHEKVDTFVIFGAAHSYAGVLPAVYDKGSWLTCLGQIEIDETVAAAILQSGTAKGDPQSHRYEHSIEVQVPFIQQLFPDSKIVPVVAAPTAEAIACGRAAGDIIKGSDKRIVCIGSTDLTHYGPRYGFEPMGIAEQAYKWASEVNDRKFIDLALKLEPEKMLESSEENSNACGGGAAAAAVAAAKSQGRTEGIGLRTPTAGRL